MAYLPDSRSHGTRCEDLDERAEAAASFVHAVGTTFPVVRDVNKTVSRALAIDALPTVVLLDRTGKVRFVVSGRGSDAGRLADALRSLSMNDWSSPDERDPEESPR